ncbi:MAG: hypothetical protein ACFB4J_16825 [Elainellaceae cyanobacterium]
MPQDASSKSPHASSALALYAVDDSRHSASTPDATTATAGLDPQAQNLQATETDPPSGGSIVKHVDSATLEASAAQVMDEVFEDVDCLLNGAASPQSGPYAQPSGTSFTTNVFMPSKAAAAEEPATAFNALVMLWGLFPAIATGLCLGLALAFGIAVSGRQMSVSPLGEGNPGSAPAPSPEDEAFLAYLDQSLETIAQKPPQTADTEEGGEKSSILSANPFEGASGPVPPPPLAAPSAPPTAAPNLPLLPSIPVQTTPIRLAPQPPAAPAPPAPAPQPQPEPPASPPEPVAAAPEPEVIPNVSPSPHVLVGLLQLGDRSAAIFEFDDGARRVRVGEAIGGSGWSLVSVSQDEAVIRRNGEVRSIYIGQSI